MAKIIPNIFKTINYLDKEDIKKVEFFYEYEQNENKFNNVYHIILDGFQGNLYPEIKLKNILIKIILFITKIIIPNIEILSTQQKIYSMVLIILFMKIIIFLKQMDGVNY